MLPTDKTQQEVCDFLLKDIEHLSTLNLNISRSIVTRTLNCLESDRILYIRELVVLPKRQLLSIPRMGKTGVSFLETALDSYNLKIGEFAGVIPSCHYSAFQGFTEEQRIIETTGFHTRVTDAIQSAIESSKRWPDALTGAKNNSKDISFTLKADLFSSQGITEELLKKVASSSEVKQSVINLILGFAIAAKGKTIDAQGQAIAAKGNQTEAEQPNNEQTLEMN